LEKDVFELIKDFPNDLEAPAISILPVISEILNELKDCDAEIAKMSGSGATCFAIFKGEKKLAEAKKKLRKKFPEFFVKEVKILSHV
jgi:4-diphosphocytidyl-2-C-methyl-D-erythritol kinase